jgi:hypothetical protein
MVTSFAAVTQFPRALAVAMMQWQRRIWGDVPLPPLRVPPQVALAA